jgi:hypothetical protein
MQIVYFTLIAIGLYFLADWILNTIEKARGARFGQRQLVFFAIILALALATFQLMRVLMQPAG